MTGPIKCDGCGAEKREANHWWALYREFDTLTIYPVRDDIGTRRLRRKLEYKGVFCGEACVIRAVSEFLGGQVAIGVGGAK